MSLLDTIVQVTITRADVFPTKAGFGIPLLMAYHTRTPNMTDLYTSLDAMISDGFAITDQAYLMASAALSVNPRPVSVVIGRRLHGSTMIVKLLPINVVVGFVYSFTYVNPGGLKTVITYTVAPSDTAIIIGTALETALAATTSPGATFAVNGSTGEITITASAAGAMFDVQGLPGLADLHVSVTTTDNNIVNDYNSIKAVDATTWYGVAIDSNDKAAIEALAVAIEADHKIFLYETSDSDCANNSLSTDVMSQLEASAYARTAGIFAQNSLRSYRACAWLAKGLASGAAFPGSNSWSFLTLNGITVDNLTDSQIANIQAKRGNVYVTTSGLNMTYSDLVADNEHIDLIVGTDWLFATLQSRGLAAFYNRANSGSKVPYTDAGGALLQGVVLGCLADGQRDNGQGGSFLDPAVAPICTVPKVATIDPSLKASRIFPDVNFVATLAGAINAVQISGVLSL